jgi:DUF2933 family protein
MWTFVQDNWQTILLLLAVLACPLMHAFGRHGGHRPTPSGGTGPR